MFGNPRAGTTFAGPASVGLHSEIVRKALIRRSILEPDLRRLSGLGMVSEEGVFAEDFTCRQLDGVIINLGSDYMPYGHLPHEPGSVCRGAKSRSDLRITSWVYPRCLPDVHWTS